MTQSPPQPLSLCELKAILAQACAPSDEAVWHIFRYMQANLDSMNGEEARHLLAAYMRLRNAQPSLVNSCLLSMAAKVSARHADFQFDRFLQLWGYPGMLRPEDHEAQRGKDGRTFTPLADKVEQTLGNYLLKHPCSATYERRDILSMLSVKVFEKMTNGRKARFVKLIAPDGTEMIADCHLFPCRPYDTLGHLFDALVRTSKQGNKYITAVVLSQKKPAEVFPIITGYVNHIDATHQHAHIYDAQSRHYVAERPKIALHEGEYLTFCPIIPTGDKFKTALPIAPLDKIQGRQTFGQHQAEVDHVDTERGFLHYKLLAPLPPTPEGEPTIDGFASLDKLAADSPRKTINRGDRIMLTIFLKRKKDGLKHNHVAEILVPEQ